MNKPPAAAPEARGDPRARRKLALLAAIAVAPVALSYAAYYLLPSDARTTNYGALLPTRPIAEIRGVTAVGAPFGLDDHKGRWLLLVAAAGGCDETCQRMLYATRQARTIQNAAQDRVVRIWLVTDDVTPAASLLAQHPGLVVARVPAASVAALPHGARTIYLVDPLGNQVLAWPVDPDVKALARDLARLLKASRIG
jgi:hypothetical protein